MPVGFDFRQDSPLLIEQLEKSLREKDERIMSLETENAMLHLRTAQLMRSQQAAAEVAMVTRIHYQQQLVRAKQAIHELKQCLSYTKNEMRIFERKTSEQLVHSRRVVEQYSQISRVESSTVSELQRKFLSLQQQLKDISEKHEKERKQRKQLHNDLMELRGNIRVHCRLRPVFHTDVQGDPVTSVRTSPEQPEVALYFLDDENICVRSSKHNKVFEFERYNVCIMAYGQTGSGKTHTMLGSHKNENYNLSHEAHPDEGVIPRAMRELFSLMSEKPTGTYQAEVSVVEIYNNDIRDLLSKDFKSKHDLVTCPDGSLSLPTVTFRQVASVKSVMSCVVHGLRTRRESATLVHEHSSRSHLVVTLLITTNDTTRAWHTDPATSDWSSSAISSNLPLSKERGRTTPPNVSSPNPSVIKTKLQLVDLAGSECVGLSGVKGAAFRETSSINKSLSALADVLGALAERRTHVPYRNSRLTYFLQDSIGGDAKLLLLLCVSPTKHYITESLQCLGFGQRARQVQRGPAKRRLPTTMEKSEVSAISRSHSKTPPVTK
ncbi:kinesin-like protein KIF25 isoform X2 [Octopus sinensis]|uniref:Kinesin-like protein KIF25 isoform X2 n=1 Tax=Octopus sinensis TaxID=2607531 RepID=A0A7E6ETK6_9MOLL|nr:kinesin-like protein KIF25 isoform X2 [Octopus sinensis]